MSILKNLVVGRDNGIRAKLRRSIFGGPTDTSPDSAHSSPNRPRSAQPEAAEKALGLFPEAPKDVTPPEGYEVVLHKDALKPGKLTEIIIGGTAIAVYNVDGTIYATSNSCAHADGPLGEGSLDGKIVTCPYHGWQYDVTTGACKTTEGAKVKTFDVKLEGDAVCVRL